jgi:hypothetical protein
MTKQSLLLSAVTLAGSMPATVAAWAIADQVEVHA